MKIKMIKLVGCAVAATLAGSALPAIAQQAPAAAVAPADPAHIAAAQAVVNEVFPAGTYRKMMSGTFDKMMGSMSDQMLNIPVADIARIGGVPEEKLKSVKPATLKQMMLIIDPSFQKRMDAVMPIMMSMMVDMMDKMEPDVRAGVVEAYANRFTTPQLAELDRFFSTPTGSVYAAQSMLVYTDPAVIERMQKMMPKLLEMMPDMMKKIKSATAAFPPMPKGNQLTKEQRDKLTALLGGS
ncbi:MAG TPA: DUF2059 domain-containing protein [Sphingomonas sp.]|nr:DUF2059 domain-containing protein [Sphingomonas sp.]